MTFATSLLRSCSSMVEPEGHEETKIIINQSSHFLNSKEKKQKTTSFSFKIFLIINKEQKTFSCVTEPLKVLIICMKQSSFPGKNTRGDANHHTLQAIPHCKPSHTASHRTLQAITHGKPSHTVPIL